MRSKFDVGELYRNNFDVYGSPVVRFRDETVTVDQKSKISEHTDIDLVLERDVNQSGNETATQVE